MTTRSRIHWLAGLLAISAPSVEAQSAADRDRAVRDQTLSSAPVSSQNQVLFTIGPEGKLLQANFRGNLDRLEYFLRASGPIDEKGEPTLLADLDGLRASTRVAFGASVETWETSSDPARARTWCREHYATHFPSEVATTIATRTAGVLDSIALHRLSQGRTLTSAERDRLGDSVATRLRTTAIEGLVTTRCARSAVPQEFRSRFERAADVSFGLPFLFGISLEFAKFGFTFADTAQSTIEKASESGIAFNIGSGVYWPQARVFAMLGFRHEISYQGGKVADYCLPVAATSALRCQSVAFGAPSKQTASIFHVGVRWFASENVGFSPRFNFEIGEPGRVGFELPILSRQADDKGFTAALILGVRSRDQRDPKSKTEYLVAAQLGQVFGINLP